MMTLNFFGTIIHLLQNLVVKKRKKNPKTFNDIFQTILY